MIKFISPRQAYLRLALWKEPKTEDWRWVWIGEKIDARWVDGRWETRPHEFTKEEADLAVERPGIALGKSLARRQTIWSRSDAPARPQTDSPS